MTGSQSLAVGISVARHHEQHYLPRRAGRHHPRHPQLDWHGV